jgi:hypothetical protein
MELIHRGHHFGSGISLSLESTIDPASDCMVKLDVKSEVIDGSSHEIIQIIRCSVRAVYSPFVESASSFSWVVGPRGNSVTA